MWNLISGNQLIEQRNHKKSMQRHKQSLSKIKSTFKIRQPEKPQFIYLKPKLQMSRRDRLIEIDRQNQMLFNKMNLLKVAQYKENRLRPQAQQLKTLNQGLMVQKADHIYHENIKICKRLTSAKTYYPTFKIIGDVEEIERLNNKSKLLRIQSARNINNRPRSSSKSVSSKLYKSKMTTYDKDGNSSQQKIKIIYKVVDQEYRPNSASVLSRQSRPKSSSRMKNHKFENHDKNLQFQEYNHGKSIQHQEELLNKKLQEN